MEVSNDKIREYTRRIILSRMRILMNNGFYALLIMHLQVSVGDEFDTAWTDGTRVWLNPAFLDAISDDELDYVLMHQILHIVLKHGEREIGYEHMKFQIACDIVVNSNIYMSSGGDEKSISLRSYGGVQMHFAPDGSEGYEHSVEEIYYMLEQVDCTQAQKGDEGDCGLDSDQSGENEGDDGIEGGGSATGKNVAWDHHSKLEEMKDDEAMKDVWEQRLLAAAEAISIRDPSNKCGSLPAFAERMLMELKKTQIDWRTILNEFVQEEVCDYSFMPPDKRFDDNPFFLPDYNEKDNFVKDILFMIDTSGSMSDEMITTAYSEVKGAIDQFDGHLKGWLGFFDADVIEPREFESEDEFCIIRPVGGGGTNFHVIFHYVNQHMQDNLPTCIIILTDGYADFPKEQMALGIPVLWLINNEEVTPPWGKVARITDVI